MRLTMNTAGFGCWTKRRRAEILTRAGARVKQARARADDAGYLRYNLMGRADWSSDMRHRTNGRDKGGFEISFELICGIGRQRTRRLGVLLLDLAEMLLNASHCGFYLS